MLISNSSVPLLAAIIVEAFLKGIKSSSLGNSLFYEHRLSPFNSLDLMITQTLYLHQNSVLTDSEASHSHPRAPRSSFFLEVTIETPSLNHPLHRTNKVCQEKIKSLIHCDNTSSNFL
ncbi:hypothetical protein GEMRC1_011983 [Eukaryota sp. GEM-RC1]